MGELQGFQKRYLRGLGHALRPVVVVGSRGLTDAVIDKARAELEAHELIKVRLSEGRPQRDAQTSDLAGATDSEVAGRVGNTALLYRAQPDPQRRRIRVPARPDGGPA